MFMKYQIANKNFGYFLQDDDQLIQIGINFSVICEKLKSFERGTKSFSYLFGI